jgi:hypothetical protein
VALAGHSRVTVTTFHRWAVRCGVDFSQGIWTAVLDFLR